MTHLDEIHPERGDVEGVAGECADVTIYAEGLIYTSACAAGDLSGEDVAREVNRRIPSGTKFGWSVDGAGVFRTGEPNPCPCHDDKSRKHWLLSC